VLGALASGLLSVVHFQLQVIMPFGGIGDEQGAEGDAQAGDQSKSWAIWLSPPAWQRRPSRHIRCCAVA